MSGGQTSAVAQAGLAQHVASKASDAGTHVLRMPELELAYACTCQDPAAIVRFEATYFDEVDAAVRRFPNLPVTLDDIRQRVRQKLFVDSPPALAGYAGTGELRGWLRALVLHMLLNVSARETREQPTRDAFFDGVVDGSLDAETAYLKESCRAELTLAFVTATHRLAPREKTLLQYAFNDGLSVDQIGVIFGVHRATAARWVAAARERLVLETRADLMARLRVDSVEAESILRAALSQVGTTLLRHLR
jgi:RNA polymerase sigma-70 factor (ECF subfamily)